MKLKKIEKASDWGKLYPKIYKFFDLLFFFENRTSKKLQSSGTYAKYSKNVGALIFAKIKKSERWFRYEIYCCSKICTHGAACEILVRSWTRDCECKQKMEQTYWNSSALSILFLGAKHAAPFQLCSTCFF